MNTTTEEKMSAIEILRNIEAKTLSAIKNSFSFFTFQENLRQAITEAKEIKIEMSIDVDTASHYVMKFKEITKELTSIEKKLLEPLTAEKRTIDTKMKDIKNFISEISNEYSSEVNRLGSEIIKMKNKIEAERKAEALRQQQLLDEMKLQDAIKEEALQKEEVEKGIIEKVTVEVEQSQVIAKSTSIKDLNIQGLSSRRTKTWIVVDINAVPREFLMIDEAKIKAERMKHDFDAQSTIAGIEFQFIEKV